MGAATCETSKGLQEWESMKHVQVSKASGIRTQHDGTLRIPAVQGLRQEDHEFQVTFDHVGDAA